MAELELSIRYRTTASSLGLTTMGVLFPFWALIIPFCFGLFLALIIQMPDKLPPLVTLSVFASLFAIPAACVLITALFEDDVLQISKEGIAFPIRFLNTLGFRRERLWSDLSGVHLRWEGGTSYDAADAITLMFGSGGRVKLNLNGLDNADLEQLLLAIEVWAGNCRRPPELIEFQNNLQNVNKGLPHLSYTQMWEEELSRRFNATAFVPLEPGKLLKGGHLRVVRQLAFGGLSAIYLAQLDEQKLVVLKEAVVPQDADQASKAKADELFDREAMLLMKLDHPRIASVIGHFAEEGRNYLILEYINGQDLRQFVKQNGPQGEALVVDWAFKIADILEHLHSQEPPIIHRDLTPDNLVLQESGDIVLIDFGAANEFVGTATGTLVGKQSYIAPEQFRGKARTTSDLYALGATLFFLLTGEDPEALSVSRPRETGSEISDKLDSLVADLTNLDDAGRLQNAKEVKDRLTGIVPVSSISAKDS